MKLKKKLLDMKLSPLTLHAATIWTLCKPYFGKFGLKHLNRRKFNNDSARVVRESAIVATDMIDYWAH